MFRRQVTVMSAERRTVPMKVRIGKWLGLWCGALAALLDQQIVSQTMYTKCTEQSTQFTLLVGALCIGLGLFGAIFSASVYRRLPDRVDTSASARTDRFIAALSILMACFAVLFVIFGSSASFFLRCER